jgi:hypothetical protein
VRPTPLPDNSAALVVPNITVRTEAQLSIFPLSLYDLITEKLLYVKVLKVLKHCFGREGGDGQLLADFLFS